MTENMKNYPWLGSFQTSAEIEAYLSESQVTCLLCGKPFFMLAGHIKAAHEMTLDDYKLRYSIPWSRGLVGAATRKKCSMLMKHKQAIGVVPKQPSKEHLAK